jgi:hypothetical protein
VDLDKDGALRPIAVDHRTGPAGRSSGVHFQVSHVFGPSAIEYFNDYNSLRVQCLSSDGTIRKHSIKDLGSRKHTNWRFENEYRFRLFASFPEGQEGDLTFLSPEEIREVVTKLVDVPLDQCALNEARILLGPKTTDAHRLMVESLCARYAPKIDISKSAIRIRL